jgi:hypothetical protein
LDERSSCGRMEQGNVIYSNQAHIKGGCPLCWKWARRVTGTGDGPTLPTVLPNNGPRGKKHKWRCRRSLYNGERVRSFIHFDFWRRPCKNTKGGHPKRIVGPLQPWLCSVRNIDLITNSDKCISPWKAPLLPHSDVSTDEKADPGWMSPPARQSMIMCRPWRLVTPAISTQKGGLFRGPTRVPNGPNIPVSQ